jgi:hypothetical protein
MADFCKVLLTLMFVGCSAAVVVVAVMIIMVGVIIPAVKAIF